MVFCINNFCFDSQRMILYSNKVSDDQLKLIEDTIPIDEPYDENYEKLLKIHEKNMCAKKALPNSGGICLTYKCGFACNYCTFESTSSGRMLSIEEINSYLVFLTERYCISRSLKRTREKLKIYITGGGEPTYNWELFTETIKLVQSRCGKYGEYEIHLTTNGDLNSKQLDFILDNVDSVMVSYDGISSIQNKNRHKSSGEPSAPQVEKTLNYLDTHNAPYTIRTTIWPNDYEKLKEMADYIYTAFPHNKGWSISPVLPSGRAVRRFGSHEQLKERHDFIDIFWDTAAYVKSRYHSDTVSVRLFPLSVTGIMCGSGFVANPWLLPGGDMVTCLEAPQNHRPVIGKATPHGVKLVDTYCDDLISVYKQSYVSSKCRNCLAFRFCGGGCPLNFIRDEDSDVYGSSWICEQTQHYWQLMLNRLFIEKAAPGWTIRTITIEGGVQIVKIE